ncbi:MAG: IPT/TIG domain-containing protein [Patescibacteria group bacterium]
MNKKFAKNLLSLLIVVTGLLVFRYAFAQDFGTTAVNNGLGGVLGADDPRTIIGRIINVGLGLLGVIALGLIIYAGFLWMTSAGEEDKIATAKKILTSAVIGLAIILASWAIATFIISRLSGAINGPGGDTGCVEGKVSVCRCDGSMICTNGAWSQCVGWTYDCGGTPGPTSCDSDTENPGCQAVDQICSSKDYCDVDCKCKPKGEAGNSCDANSKTATCDADNNLCGNFLACDNTTCTCVGTPVITDITPAGGFCEDNVNKSCSQDTDCQTVCNKTAPNGTANNFITISGKNFGEYSSAVSRVVFMGGSSKNGRNPSEINPICVNFWQDDQIIIAVPAGVANGPIKVVRTDNLEDITNNNYGTKIPDFVANNITRPGLCLLSPNKGALSSSVSYQGMNLFAGQAYFGNYQANVKGFDSNFSHPSGLSGTAATPNIRSGVSGSFVVGNNKEKSNFLKFVKEANPNDGPYIVSFDPPQGKSGQYVTITGNGFGWSKGSSHVYFEGVEASYSFPSVCASSIWGDKQIVVKVPEDIANGNYVIRISLAGKTIDTQSLSPNNVFKVDDSLSLAPGLCKLEPKQGAVSTPVKLYGEYFGQVGHEGLVQFNPKRNAYNAIKLENGAQLISATVPTSTITGPVKIVKSIQESNALNFEVSSCSMDAECPNQVCCPSYTYKKGRCVNELSECLVDIPTSVFEWGFSTGFATTTPSQESCKTLATYFGTCQTGSFCPNVPGQCSPDEGGTPRTVGSCDFSCASVTGCSGFGSICSYDQTLNKCVKNGEIGKCSPAKMQTFDLGGKKYDLNLVCNDTSKHWETKTPTSCPNGWEMGVKVGANNICTDVAGPLCSTCAVGLSCEKVGLEDRCVSPIICKNGGICEDNVDINKPDNCVVIDKPSCDCCCRKDQVAQDCCAATNPDSGAKIQLQCGGACGADKTGDSNLGRCGGCKLTATSTPAQNDAACNCTGHSGQYCSITDETPAGICTDCTGLEGLTSCSEHNTACCFDSKRTQTVDDDICRGVLGNAVITATSSPDFGYCGYFGCNNTSTPPIGDPLLCATTTMLKIGLYKDPYSCVDGCAKNVPEDVCGAFDNNPSGCTTQGTCCYDAEAKTCNKATQLDSNNQPICCGCTKDSDCTNPNPAEFVGCGFSSCCEARPQIIETKPKSGEANICRNSVLQATFNQEMNIASFSSNVILLQEVDKSTTCPSGTTFVYEGNSKFAVASDNWLINIFNKFKISVSKLFGNFNNQALADLPDPNKSYCSFPGNASGEYVGTTTTILKFSPQKLLAPNTKYFLVIKGDEDLNSLTGVVNSSEIGFNGFGLDQVGNFVQGDFKAGKDLSFNSTVYKNSHILQFKTLADSSKNHGVCEISRVQISPSSYLFKTVEDDLDENDNDPKNKTFDTKHDKDKVFTATAYSDDNQILKPVTGYFWDFKFELIDPSIVSLDSIPGLSVNQAFVSANPLITDGRTKLKATIDMTRFLDSGSSIDPNCSCLDESCSSRCRNAYSGGDNFSGLSSLYILICDNPWPPIRDNGTWAPWSDVNFGDSIYYCRDAGQPGTFDDLPLLIDEAVVGQQNNNFVCSSDNTICSPSGSACGADKNGDGKSDGICIWSVLREYFFFREKATPGGEITSLVDKAIGKTVTVNWHSTSVSDDYYKIYYGETNKPAAIVKEVKKDGNSCRNFTESGGADCTTEISNLNNGQSYTFRLSVVSLNKVESPLSVGKNVTPTDKLAPAVPLNFKVENNTNTTTIKLSWAGNSDDTLFYRVYRGTRSGVYGESFDTSDKATSTILNKTKLTVGANYFVISALDNYNNESGKSDEKTFIK